MMLGKTQTLSRDKYDTDVTLIHNLHTCKLLIIFKTRLIFEYLMDQSVQFVSIINESRYMLINNN